MRLKKMFYAVAGFLAVKAGSRWHAAGFAMPFTAPR